VDAYKEDPGNLKYAFKVHFIVLLFFSSFLNVFFYDCVCLAAEKDKEIKLFLRCRILWCFVFLNLS